MTRHADGVRLAVEKDFADGVHGGALEPRVDGREQANDLHDPPRGRRLDRRLARRQTWSYTEHMFGSRDVPRCLGSRRLGGPVLLKDVLLALLEELHEVREGGRPAFDSALAQPRPPEDETPDASFSRAA